MIKLGEKQTLVVIKEVDFGVYLAESMDSEEKVLLPGKQVPADAKLGSKIQTTDLLQQQQLPRSC